MPCLLVAGDELGHDVLDGPVGEERLLQIHIALVAAGLGSSNEALNQGPHLLGALEGGRDALVGDQIGGEVPLE
jgi:hypothetical protein